MTFWDLFALWRRQWIATSLCLLAVLGGGWYLDRSVSEVYWASTSVVIRPPFLRGHLAPLGRDAIPLAGVVEKRLNAVNHAPPAVSPDVSIVDRGIYDGWVANVPDYGGQWANNFTNPVIVVQASGPSPARVEQQIRDVTDQISAILVELQDESGVRATMRAESLPQPPSPIILRSSGLRNRALVAVGLIGLIIMAMGPYGVDFLTRRSAYRFQGARADGLIAS